MLRGVTTEFTRYVTWPPVATDARLIWKLRGNFCQKFGLIVNCPNVDVSLVRLNLLRMLLVERFVLLALELLTSPNVASLQGPKRYPATRSESEYGVTELWLVVRQTA